MLSTPTKSAIDHGANWGGESMPPPPGDRGNFNFYLLVYDFAVSLTPVYTGVPHYDKPVLCSNACWPQESQAVKGPVRLESISLINSLPVCRYRRRLAVCGKISSIANHLDRRCQRSP